MKQQMNKRKIIAGEIDRVKRKRMEVDTCIQSLNKEASHDMTMFLKANAFRKAISRKKATISDLDEVIKKLEENLKKK